jgi:hypothetical protein
MGLDEMESALAIMTLPWYEEQRVTALSGERSNARS